MAPRRGCFAKIVPTKSANSSLLDAEFTYNVPEWRPEVNYTVTGKQGKLIVNRRDTDFYFVTDDVRYEWDLANNSMKASTTCGSKCFPLCSRMYSNALSSG